MALDATVGGTASNSYALLAEANVYFSERPFSTVWTEDAGPLEKEAALIYATRLISAKFPWTGTASTDTQALPWPRESMLSRTGYPLANNVIPADLKYATFELAYWLLQEDRLGNISPAVAQGLKRIQAGPMELEWQNMTSEDTLALREFVIPDVVKMLLVPSWYEVVVALPPVFETLG